MTDVLDFVALPHHQRWDCVVLDLMTPVTGALLSALWLLPRLLHSKALVSVTFLGARESVPVRDRVAAVGQALGGKLVDAYFYGEHSPMVQATWAMRAGAAPADGGRA